MAATRAALASLLAVGVLAGVAGGALYHLHERPVATDYEAPDDAAVPFEHYETSLVVAAADGSDRYAVNRTVAPNRSLVRLAFRTDEGRNLVRRATVGGFDYVVQRPAAERRFEARFDHDATKWVAAHRPSRTIYAQEWRGESGGFFTAEYVASRFAYRKTGETTYRGVPAETYAVKSWWLPRETGTWKGSGRLVVAAESGAILRFSATTARGDGRLRIEHRKLPVDPPDRPVGADVVRAVRRNVTVNTSVYPDRYGTAPAAYAAQSGDVVGVEFEADEASVPLPAGSEVVATDRNGTNYTATLDAPFRPRRGDDGPVLDLAYAVRDGELVRTDVGGAAGPLRPGPDLRRLVVRDPASGWTYVNATVRGAGVENASVRSEETRGGHRYAWFTAVPETGGGSLHYRLIAPNGTVAAEGGIRANPSVSLAWIDRDTVWIFPRTPEDDVVAAPNGTRTVTYRLVITGPRGRLVDDTVEMDRPVANATTA